jgi:hypothetical protein
MIFKVRNRRIGSKSRKSFYLNLFIPLFFITLTLCSLPLYTPWILNKDGETFKEWFPPNPIGFISIHIKSVINENIISAWNAFLIKEPEEIVSIPTTKIWIENSGLEKMNHELLNYNLNLKKKKPKVNGHFRASDTNILKAKINIRGTRATHQMIWKPSIRVKLKKNKLYGGFRNHTFIGPEDVLGIRNWISAELGRKWNILSNLESFSRLYINNKNFGLYNTVAPMNESLLIQTGRLPGPILDFNIFNKQLFFIRKKQWYKPDAWKATEKKHWNSNNLINGPLIISKRVLNSRSKDLILDDLITLNHYISQEKFAKYLAILVHGGEKHYLNNHNAKFWINPSSGLMEPIISDQNGYGLSLKDEWIKKPVIKHEGAFVKVWFKNPLNQEIYIENLYELIDTIGHEKEMERMIRDQWDKIKTILPTEPFLSYMCWPARCYFPINKLGDEVDKLISDIKLRIDWLRKELNRDQIILLEEGKENFKVLVLGYAGAYTQRIDGKKINLEPEETSTNKTPTKLKNSNNQIKAKGEAKVKLLPSISIANYMSDIKLSHSYSFYNLSGKPSDYIFKHRLSGKEIPITATKANYDIDQMNFFSGINYLNFPKADTKPVYFGPGKVKITESKIFSPGKPIIIKAGTEFYLDKDVQIIVQGPLTIKGTSGKPVTIKPINPKKPFGVFALLGKETKGSKINFLKMEGGSIGKHYNLNFSGMLSIHDCPHVEITNSNFGKNYLGDDAVHIVNSTAVIKSSIFKNSKMDALDLDLVNGELVNNQFINPGNDGLDLSMGKTIVNKNRFLGCKDKCISVGEGAETTISNSYFQNCNNGVAVKDKSDAILKNSIIDNCNIGWNSYRKKWRWESGGKGKIINSKFLNMNIADISGDKLSSVSLIKQNLANLKIIGNIKVKTLN